MRPPMRAGVLLLADARFPAGVHAHSAGVERAVDLGLVRDLPDVAAWADDVLHTAGLTAAALAARSCRLAVEGAGQVLPGQWDRLDAECDARVASPAQRRVSRRLGRQLVRTATRVWSSELLEHLGVRWSAGPHRPLASGAAVAVAGGTPEDAALAEVYGAVTVPVGAAVRLLGLDPVEGAAVLADLAPAMDRVAALSARASLSGDDAGLPARSAPVLDLCAELHATAEGALFAS